MVDLFKIVENSKVFNIEKFNEIAFSNFYIRKYGSIEEAEKVFDDLRLKCNSEEEYFEARERKIQSDIPFEQFKAIIAFIQSLQSFSTVVDREKAENELAIDAQSNPDKWQLVLEILNDYDAFMNEQLGNNKELIKEKLLLELNEKISFTIKETREELGFKNQRTFKKWLTHFYDNKYDSSRKFTLLEYIDVIKKFVLKPDEKAIDLNNNIEEYRKRLSDGLVVKKSNLKEMTNNDYKLLKNEIDDLIESDVLKLPENVDFYPYSISQLIKKYLE